MNRFTSWLRSVGYKLKTGLQRFMMGRYGTDKLNTLILGVALVLCLISMFMPLAWLRLTLAALSYAFMGYAIFRCLSRNTYKRYLENRKYLAFLARIKDREHKYFQCPKCRQSVRVPKGKGKISITCPKCKEKFIKKT